MFCWKWFFFGRKYLGLVGNTFSCWKNKVSSTSFQVPDSSLHWCCCYGSPLPWSERWCEPWWVSQFLIIFLARMTKISKQYSRYSHFLLEDGPRVWPGWEGPGLPGRVHNRSRDQEDHQRWGYLSTCQPVNLSTCYLLPLTDYFLAIITPGN